MRASKYICFSLRVREGVRLSQADFPPRVPKSGSHAGECEVGAAVVLAILIGNQASGTELASATGHWTQQKTGNMQGVVRSSHLINPMDMKLRRSPRMIYLESGGKKGISVIVGSI